MRYTEASRLYALLGNETRLRMMKALYQCRHMTSEQLMEKAKCTIIPFHEHVRLLLAAELIFETYTNDMIYFYCNVEKVEELFSFLQSKHETKRKKGD